MKTERYLVRVYHDDGVHTPFEAKHYLVYNSEELMKFVKALEKDLKSAKKTLRKQYVKSTIYVSAISGFRKAWEYSKDFKWF